MALRDLLLSTGLAGYETEILIVLCVAIILGVLCELFNTLQLCDSVVPHKFSRRGNEASHTYTASLWVAIIVIFRTYTSISALFFFFRAL